MRFQPMPRYGFKIMRVGELQMLCLCGFDDGLCLRVFALFIRRSCERERKFVVYAERQHEMQAENSCRGVRE